MYLTFKSILTAGLGVPFCRKFFPLLNHGREARESSDKSQMIDQGPLVICCMEGTILPSRVEITVYISKAMKSGSGDEPISTSWNVRVLLTLLTCRFHICCWWPDDFTRFQRMPRLANLLQSDATQKLSPRQKRCSVELQLET